MQATESHPAGWTDERLLRACVIRFVRRSGPGGQHRNKVESGVQLEYGPAGLVAEANERRNQAENRRVAVWRMRVQLAVRVRAAYDPERPPPEFWRKRIRAGRIAVSDRHADFPVLLACALDCLSACEWDVRRAAAALSCTGTQLVRFLSGAPSALGALNAERAARGLRALR